MTTHRDNQRSDRCDAGAGFPGDAPDTATVAPPTRRDPMRTGGSTRSAIERRSNRLPHRALVWNRVDGPVGLLPHGRSNRNWRRCASLKPKKGAVRPKVEFDRLYQVRYREDVPDFDVTAHGRDYGAWA